MAWWSSGSDWQPQLPWGWTGGEPWENTGWGKSRWDKGKGKKGKGKGKGKKGKKGWDEWQYEAS